MAQLIESGRPPDGWVSRVTGFICTTEFAKQKFLQYGLDKKRVHVKRNFSPDLAESYERREGDYALYMGRLSEEKGIRTLLQAWPGEKKQLVFVGSGPLAEEVRAHGHTVHSGLAQAEAFRYLAACRFLVMPTECYESGVPLVLLEAMSLRVPVICSRFGAAGEVFRSGENALIFTPGDGKELRQALERGIKEGPNLRQWAEAARRIYESEFHPRNNLARLLEIYQTVSQGVKA
jgi:glycosyltransferase involved in cell wall biosynthesis